MAEETLLGYMHMEAHVLDHIGEVRTGGRIDYVSIPPLCGGILPRNWLERTPVEDEQWKGEFAEYDSASDVLDAYRDALGKLCPHCESKLRKLRKMV